MRRTAQIRRLIRERKFKYLLFLVSKAARQAVSYVLRPCWYLAGREKFYDRMYEDDRFHVDGNLMRTIFRFPPVVSWDVEKVRLCDIKRFWEGEIISLYASPAYSFAAHGDLQGYREYVSVHWLDAGAQSRLTREQIEKGIDDDVSRFRETIRQMKSTDYDIRKGAVVLDSNNVILDGVHRTCALLCRYGPEHEIAVLRVRRSVL